MAIKDKGHKIWPIKIRTASAFRLSLYAPMLENIYHIALKFNNCHYEISRMQCV